MSLTVNITIWGWRGLGIGPGGSVGHVMISESDTSVDVSQFPHGLGGEPTPWGPNTTLTFSQTNTEMDRPPGVVYTIDIPDPAAFAAAANDHRSRPDWCWDPEPPFETHCARAAYDVLKAGGVNIDAAGDYAITNGERREIIPNTLWSLLEDLPQAQITQRSEENIPMAIRRQYESNVKEHMRAYRIAHPELRRKSPSRAPG
ncbi:MAG TPA: hypothetical protein VMU33_08155 [Burkholderiaceae bacterium]|nr:hypothetical protein [Burkholderiaceae bacterium]